MAYRSLVTWNKTKNLSWDAFKSQESSQITAAID
jgi:hypothetical protein